MSETTRILPDGTTTNDANIYIQAWQDLMSLSEKIFTGYKCVGFNQGVRMIQFGKNTFGERIIIDSFDISIKALNILREKVSQK